MVFSLQAYQSPGRQHLSHWARDLQERFNVLSCTSMRDHDSYLRHPNHVQSPRLVHFLDALLDHMKTNQVTAQLLHEQIDRTTRWVVAAMAISWLFSALSLYFSLKTGKDWFPRSGSVMCLFGAAGAFRLVNSHNKALFLALTKHVELDQS